MTNDMPASQTLLAISHVRQQIAVVDGSFRPRLGLILGSGLGGIADAIQPLVTIPYQAIPGFPRPTVAGHDGSLVLGWLGGLPIACLRGRVHGYEGKGFADLATAIRTLKGIGCDTLFLTCAAGSLNAEVGAGQLLMISDHLNLMGSNPLIGPNDPSVGPRFPGLLDAWDPALRQRLAGVAKGINLSVVEGVYAAVTGPSFETPAEVRMLARLGADAVGMSTVPECILARHCGLRVGGIAVITNLAVGLGDGPVDHEQTLRAAGAAADDLQRLLVALCADLSRSEEGVPA